MSKLINAGCLLLISGQFFFSSCSNKDDLGDDANAYFIKYYGNTEPDEGFEVIQTDDGGFALFGTRTNPGTGSDMALLKTDEFGNLQWEKFYGGAGDDVGRSFRIRSDGAFVMVGTFEDDNPSPNDEPLDAYLVWADDKGDELDNMKINYRGNSSTKFNTEGYAIALEEVLGLNEVMVVGYSSSQRIADPLGAFESNPAGKKDIMYARCKQGDANPIIIGAIGYAEEDAGFAVTQIPSGQPDEGDYLVTGYVERNLGKLDPFLARIPDTVVDVISVFFSQLDKDLGGQSITEGRSIEYVSDNEIYVTGTAGNGTLSRLLLMSGSQAEFFSGDHTVTQYGDQGFTNKGFGLDYAGAGEVVIAGSTNSSTNGGTDAYLIKVGNDGSIIWEKRYGGSGDESTSSVIVTRDGGYGLLGFSDFERNSLIQFIKTDSKGIVGN